MKSTSENTVNPGDIHKIMSAPGKLKASSKMKQTSFSKEIASNGKNYRECSQH